MNRASSKDNGGPAIVPSLPGSGSILVMDDDPSILRVTEVMLEYLGYRVATCTDGEEAIATYKAASESGTPFTAVIMALTTRHGMGGKDAAERILCLDPGAELIISSRDPFEPVMTDHKRYGFRAALPKPYSLFDLKELLTSLAT